jgi:hypothetical protein
MSGFIKHLTPIAILAAATWATHAFLLSPEAEKSFARMRRPASIGSEIEHSRSQTKHNVSEAKLENYEYRPRSGRRYTYSFERRISFQGLPSQSGQPSELSYHGQLEIDVLKSSEAQIEALIRARLAEHPVSRPVTLKFVMSAGGDRMEVFGNSLRNEQEQQEAAILKDLLALWDFHLKEDTVGPYQAKFDENPLRKTKITYTESKTAVLPEVLASEHYLGWDEQRSLPHEISGHESTRMGTQASSISARSDYQILLIRDESLPNEAAALASTFKDTETLALSSTHSGKDAGDVALDLGAIRVLLEGLDQQDSSAKLKALGLITRALKSRPDAAADLLDLLKSQDVIRQGVQSPLFQTVLGSLISSGTAEGQRAALQVYSDPTCPVSGKGAILSALTTAQAPLTSSTQDFLADTMRNEPNNDLSQGASYALSASLRRTNDETQRQEGIDAIRQLWLRSGGRLSDQLSALDAMGNSGQSAFIPELRMVIANTDAPSALRSKAVFALRFISTPEATRLLTESLSASSDFQIRQSAARAMAMAEWKDAFRSPLSHCASSDPVSSLQSVCRSVLQSSDPRLASN